MIGTTRLSGDTLIACHLPVLPLPTWQLPVQALCNSAKRSGRLCPVGLTRAVSLPEQDSINRENAFNGGRRPFSNSYSSLAEDRAEEEGTSDSSGKYDSTSSPEETSVCLKEESSEVKGSVRSRNPFLPSTELDEDEEDEDSDGDNLHRYCEDSSFVLHGNSTWQLSHCDKNCPITQSDLSVEWSHQDTELELDSDHEWLSNHLYHLDSEPLCFHENRSGISLLAYGVEDPERLKDNVSCCIHSQHNCSPELLSHTDCVSDSSCNSSDGILVNFCTMYNRSNNPATPHDLGSPALHPSQSCDGSVFLNLQPVPRTQTEELQQDQITFSPSQKKDLDTVPPASSCSPQVLNSDLNLYSLEPLPRGLSSLEVSDLTACLHSQSTLIVETNQKYYKLVTCDLLSQSPSPAWPNLTSCPEGQIRSCRSSECLSNCCKNQRKHIDENMVEIDQLKEKTMDTILDCSLFPAYDHHVPSTSTDHSPYRKMYAASQCSPLSTNCQHTRGLSTQTSVNVNPEHRTTDSTEKGACSFENAACRYSKAQRPTSLPIQPFVLSPADKPQSQAQRLGCLLEQYMNQKGTKFSRSQPSFKGKTSLCFLDRQPSPTGGHCPIFLDTPSSSDTCSTCTPSPQCVTRRHTWSQFSRSREHKLSPCASKSGTQPRPIQVQDKRSPCSSRVQTNALLNRPNQSNLIKFPTYQNLINLSPEQRQSENPLSFSHTPATLPVSTAISPAPSFSPPEKKLPQRRAAPAASSGFFHTISSLSSLLSLAAPGLQQQENQDSAEDTWEHSQSHHTDALMLSDRPPKDLSTSHESLSSLHRRGLLRSVSRAVDLITAHFGSSRDAQEKMRLGNSSWSPTIAGLVLEHLCPTLQNILEDGLKDHKLDLIIGQRHNHCWNVVEVSTTITTCPSTRILHRLVSKIQQCPQLSSHCMRLRAFIMGLLNLRCLEFWLSHLHSQKHVVTSHYHSWAFLSISLEQCRPLFDELLLVLQPLSMMPFDLNLLLEPRLLSNRLLRTDERAASPPEPCSATLVTSWPLLKADRMVKSKNSNGKTTSHQAGLNYQKSPGLQTSRGCVDQQCEVVQSNQSPRLAPIPEWSQKEPVLVGGVDEGEDCCLAYADDWSQISMSSGHEETRDHGSDSRSPHLSTCVQEESLCQGELRWAKLFGAAGTSPRVSQSHIGAQARRRPSEWLHLDRTQLGLLAQSMKSVKLVGSQIKKN